MAAFQHVRAPIFASLSEMLFISVLFHIEACKNVKALYLYGICVKHRDKFQEVPSYARFVQLMPRLLVPLLRLVFVGDR